MKPSELLRDSHSLISSYGWVQGTFGGQKDGYCMIGALNAVTKYDDMPNRLRARNYIDRAVAARVNCPTMTWLYAEDWNDVTGRTKEDVLLVLDEAAKLAEGDGQ